MTEVIGPPGATASSRSTSRSRCSAATSTTRCRSSSGRALPDVRDGLKPVHTPRPLRDVRRRLPPRPRLLQVLAGRRRRHGELPPARRRAIYDALVRLAQPWSMRMPLVDGQGNFGSPGNDPPAAMRYTECRLAPLAMEMLRDINQETVDFRPNYDGRSPEPVVLPAGSRTSWSTAPAASRSAWRPTSRRTTCARSPPGVQWYLDNSSGSRSRARRQQRRGRGTPLRGARAPRRADGAHPGPGLPDPRPDRRTARHREAYRTGRGSITMRAVVEVEEIQRPPLPGRQGAPVPGQPGQPGHEDRRAGQGRAAVRHRRRRRRDQRPHRAAAGDHAQAGRRRQGRAEQPVQAHAAAGHASA